MIIEYARILKADGNIVILGKKPELIYKHLKKNFPDHKLGQFKLGYLGQQPWVIYALYSH